MNGSWTPERHAVRDFTRELLGGGASNIMTYLCAEVDSILDKMTDEEIQRAVTDGTRGPFPARLAKMLLVVALVDVAEAYDHELLRGVKRVVLKAQRR
jgi:hypothetical protein